MKPKAGHNPTALLQLHDRLVGELARLQGVGQQLDRACGELQREATNRAAETWRIRERMAARIGEGGADSLASRHADVLLADEVRHRAVAHALGAPVNEDAEG